MRTSLFTMFSSSMLEFGSRQDTGEYRIRARIEISRPATILIAQYGEWEWKRKWRDEYATV